MRSSSFITIIPTCLFVVLVMCSVPVQAQQTERSPAREFGLNLPLIDIPDGIESISFGVGWQALVNQPVTQLGYRSGENSVRIADGAWRIHSTGKWLLEEERNQQPLTFALGFDAGIQYVERPDERMGDGPIVVIDDGASPPFFRELLHSYRMAFTLETGLETDQRFDFVYAHAGPGLMLINAPTSGRTAYFPTVSLFYDGVIEIENSLNEDGLFSTSHSRWRLVQEHVFSLGAIGLSRLMVVGGYQYTRDLGQTGAWREAGLDERFGWYAELGLETRWAGSSGSQNRVDVFMRFTDGEVAPLFDTDQSFMVGIRLPYNNK
ncbi:MAG: hypothetical protein LAT84_14250 [Balneolia bacterium]|nr:hypothetical protein [Balneolia bacterium]